MFFTVKLKHFIIYVPLIILVIIGLHYIYNYAPVDLLLKESETAAALMKKNGIIEKEKINTIDIIEKDKDFIKWVDFGITSDALNDTMKLDIETFNTKQHLNWIDILACLGTKYGGNFSKYKKSDLTNIIKNLDQGKTIEEICSNSKYYSYYHQAYSAVLREYIGEYTVTDKEGNAETKYGLKAFSPIAEGYYFSHYDDFGAGRSYGYKRRHLGHDLMTSVGTPVIAIESGIIEALGWNQYGGWRIGIRSFDKQRYYYYAHLRKDHPYAYMLSEGDIIKAGDVIGYVGMTGYSAKENVNNIDTPHLHFGIQLIFDESQKDGNSEIWIDCYEITKFLLQNKSSVYKDEEKHDYFRKTEFFEKSVENIE